MSFVGASACACTAPLCGFGADRRRGPRKHLAPKPTRCVPIESTSAVAGGSTRRGAGATCARRESYGSVVRRTGVRPWPARVTHRWRGPRPPARSDGARGLESVNDESRSKSKTRPVGVATCVPRVGGYRLLFMNTFSSTRTRDNTASLVAGARRQAQNMLPSLTRRTPCGLPRPVQPCCMPNVLPS